MSHKINQNRFLHAILIQSAANTRKEAKTNATGTFHPLKDNSGGRYFPQYAGQVDSFKSFRLNPTLEYQSIVGGKKTKGKG